MIRSGTGNVQNLVENGSHFDRIWHMNWSGNIPSNSTCRCAPFLITVFGYVLSLPSLTAGLTDGKKESIADNLSQGCRGLISFALHRATPEHLSGSPSAPKNAHQTSGEIGKTFDDSAQKPRRAKAPQDSSSAPSLPGTVGHAPDRLFLLVASPPLLVTMVRSPASMDRLVCSPAMLIPCGQPKIYWTFGYHLWIHFHCALLDLLVY
jgi:hypothetical protein